MSSRRAFKLGFALALSAGAACGGSTVAIDSRDGGVDGSVDGGALGDGTIGTDGGTGGDANGGDANRRDAQVSPFCPPAPPANGAPCTRANLTCEYGTSDDPLCNSTYECNGQTWTKGYDGTQCGFTGTNDPSCPATYSGVTKGGACGGVFLCEYPEGRCECVLGCGGPPPPIDAGTQWICSTAQPGCPSPRGDAKLGFPCTTPGQSCSYGACCSGSNQQCGDAGIWEGNIFGGGCP